MLAKEGWGLIENTGHLLGCCVNQNHLGNVDDVSLVWLFCQVTLVDIESLEVDGRDQFAVRLAKFLDESEDLLGVFLVFELLQVVIQFV